MEKYEFITSYNLKEDVYTIRGFIGKQNKITILIDRMNRWYSVKNPNTTGTIRNINIIIKNLEILKKQINKKLDKSIKFQELDTIDKKSDYYPAYHSIIRRHFSKISLDLKKDNNIDKSIRNLKIVKKHLKNIINESRIIKNDPSIKTIKFEKILHPTDYAYNKIVPIKTALMIRFEKETGKRSISKYINRPRIHEIIAGYSVKGKIILSKGFLEWKKKRNQSSAKKLTSLKRVELLRKQRLKKIKYKTF